MNIPHLAAEQRARIVEVLVEPGAIVELGEPVFAVESDKAIYDVMSDRSGTVSFVHVAVGDEIPCDGNFIVFAGESSAKADASISASAVKHRTEIRVRELPWSTNGTVVEVIVEPDEAVERSQAILAIETEKAIIDIVTPVAGVLESLTVGLGDTVHTGSIVGFVSIGCECEDEVRELPRPLDRRDTTITMENSDGRAKESQVGSAVPSLAYAGSRRHLTPSQRRSARLSDSEPAILPDRAIPEASSEGCPGLSLLPWPKIDFMKFGPIDPKPLSRIKKISGANLHRNWVMIPHVTNNDEADITELEVLRVQLNKENEKAGVKITMLAFVIKAVVSALKTFPTFNVSLDGDILVFKQYYHVGFAADTPNGLVVPVIRDADKKGLVDIAREMAELSKLARDGKLKPDQMQGGCFSISSLGGIGGTHFTPIINAPEVAILGLSKSAMKPMWDGKQFVPRLTLPLSLSYDHRVIDGAEAARFNAYLGTLLTDFRRVIL
ncbi:pyruvate dehydrogenase E2 component (dihydrolipoamide acetyltransferase) [Paraburkholderia youngii]